MKPVNIMDTLTPQPPFPATKKNKVVATDNPYKPVLTNTAKGTILAGINRTKNSLH